MKSLATAILAACTGVGVVLADAPSTQLPSTKAVVSETIRQIERDWSAATISGDFNKVSQIIADDWAGISFDGRKLDKQGFLANLKSGKDKSESIALGPMDVEVLGNVAVVQGSDIEKSVINGNDTSGRWVWTDVFVKRGGKWMAVRSQAARVK